MLEIIKKCYCYIEKRTEILPRFLFHCGGGIAILMLLYTLIDLRMVAGSGSFADLEERVVPMLEHALVCGIIPMATAALMKKIEDPRED